MSILYPEDLSRSEIETRQLEGLRQLFDAVKQNAFWRRRFESAGVGASQLKSIDSLDQLRLLPMTAKADLVEDQRLSPPYGTNLTVPGEVAHEDFEPSRFGFTRLHQTSGTTTGVPMRWLDTARNWDWFLECWSQIYRVVGVQPDDRFCFPFSFGPFIGFWAAFDGACRLNQLCLAGGGMSSLARLKLIEDNQATVVCCTPTYALRLAEVAAEEGVNLKDGSVRSLIVAGEPGGSLAGVRQRIESAWGARVFDHWGMTEIGALAVECAANPGGLHVLESECIAEIIDPASCEPAQPDESGTRQGELVLTNLGRLDSPLIRYRTGDLVTSDPENCPCGRSLLRLKGGILGRADDMITIRGNNVFPSSIEAIIREFSEVAEFRIEVATQRAMQHVKILVEPDDALDAEQESELANRIAQTIKDRLNFLAETELVPRDSLPRFELKGRRLFRTTSE